MPSQKTHLPDDFHFLWWTGSYLECFVYKNRLEYRCRIGLTKLDFELIQPTFQATLPGVHQQADELLDHFTLHVIFVDRY